nr:MAG TPA: hypothetical protein [Caudoviricetes sp.]
MMCSMKTLLFIDFIDICYRCNKFFQFLICLILFILTFLFNKKISVAFVALTFQALILLIFSCYGFIIKFVVLCIIL